MNRNKIIEICKKYNINNYTINSDLSIDVDGMVNISIRGLKKLPLVFNRVSAYFECSGNQLTTLKGSPRYVGSWFNCSSNNLTTLEGAPDYVVGKFITDPLDMYDLQYDKSGIVGYNNVIKLINRSTRIKKVLNKKTR
jgi:hypothetical protein